MSSPAPQSTVRTDDVLSLLVRIQRRLLLLTAAVAVAGVGVGALAAGLPGAYGALIATALGLFFTLTTVLLLRLVAGRGIELVAVALLGGWLIKVAVAVGLLLWLRRLDFYDPIVLFCVLAALIVSAALVEVHAVATARIPHVGPTSPAPSDRPDQTR